MNSSEDAVSGRSTALLRRRIKAAVDLDGDAEVIPSVQPVEIELDLDLIDETPVPELPYGRLEEHAKSLAFAELRKFLLEFDPRKNAKDEADDKDGVSNDKDGVSNDKDGVSNDKDGVSDDKDGGSDDEDGGSDDDIEVIKYTDDEEREADDKDGGSVNKDGGGLHAVESFKHFLDRVRLCMADSSSSSSSSNL